MGAFGRGDGESPEELQRGMRKLLRVMNIFINLIVLMASLIYTYVQMSQILHFKYV